MPLYPSADYPSILKELLDWAGLNPNQLAHAIGLKRPQAIYDIQKRKVGISKNMADRICLAFPSISKSYLLTGLGSLTLPEQPVSDGSSETDTYRLVPLLNIDAVGGMNRPNEAVDTGEYVLRHIAFNDARTDDICINVVNNSMEPTCPSGSIVLIRQVHNWQEYFGYGNIFVLLLKDGRRIIKEVTRYTPDPQHYVLCVSHNQNYPPEELPRSMIDSVYKVIKILNNRGW